MKCKAAPKVVAPIITKNDELAASVLALLHAPGPPFVTRSYLRESHGLDTLSELADDDVLNAASEGDALWDKLDALSPRASVLSRLTQQHQMHSLPSSPTPETVAAATSPTKALWALPPWAQKKSKRNSTGAVQSDDDDDEPLDDGSICISCPLKPTDAAQITLTPYDVELVPVDLDDELATSVMFLASPWWKFWDTEDGRKLKKKRRMVAKKIFRPPPGQISFKAAWWGYTLWIDSDSIKVLSTGANPTATVLGAISTVLTFIVKYVPAPVAALPGASLLLAVAPTISAIAAFLAWAWGKVRSYDKGNGIVLHATWILPVAPIVSTWKFEDDKKKDKKDATDGKCGTKGDDDHAAAAEAKS